VLVPLLPGDAIVYSRPADWRIGHDVREAILRKHPNLPLKALAMSLEPGDLRKGHTITSPGKAHFFAPKVNQCFQSRFTCQYSSTWHGGVRGFLQWKPSEIQIGDCQPVQ